MASNCNEEFVVKLIGKLTLEFNFDWQQQRKISEIIHLCLYGYNVYSIETALVGSDIEEKIMLYLQVKKLENYSKATLQNYFYTLRKFEGFIKKPIAAVNKNDIRFFLANCYQGCKASTINSKIFCLKGFFQWLTDEEIIPKNPARLIKDTKIPKRLRKSLTLQELEKLRLACETGRERALLEFIFAISQNIVLSSLNLSFNKALCLFLISTFLTFSISGIKFFMLLKSLSAIVH